MAPEIHYAKSGDVHIAYQVFGHGPENLVIIPGFISHIEHSWELARTKPVGSTICRTARIVIFDKRGTAFLIA